MIILNEEHLKRLLKEYIEEYYHIARPHQGLDGHPPFPSATAEAVTGASRLVSIPVVGGLHHRYVRVAADFVPAGQSIKTKGERTGSAERWFAC